MPAAFWAVSVAVGGFMFLESRGKPVLSSDLPRDLRQDLETAISPPSESPGNGEGDEALSAPEPLGFLETPLWTDTASLESEAPPLAFLDPPPADLTFPKLTENPEFWKVYRRRCSTSCIEEFLEDLLRVPDAMLCCAVGTLQETFHSRGTVVRWVKGEPQPLSDRFLEFARTPTEDGLFMTFTRNLAAREGRFFAGLADSEIYTYEFEDGTGELDHDEVMRKQRKIVWDAVRKTYVESYREKAEKTLKEDSFEVRAWMGRDFLVLPPMIAGYIYFRGLEKDFSVGPTRLRFSFEPLEEWLSGDDLWGAMDFECKLDGFPIGLVVSVGLHEDNLGLDFIGIGTGVGIAKKAVQLQRPKDVD
jgi:hypothetical protein